MLLDTLGIVFFSCGAMLGFLLTALLPHRPRTWWLWPAARVLWQLGGGLWCGGAVSHLIAAAGSDASGWLAIPAFGALGLALCANAALDLLMGPLHFQGHMVTREVQRGHLWVPLLVPHNPTIHGELTLQDEAGTCYTMRTSGLQENRLNRMLSGLDPRRPILLLALRRLGVPLAVTQAP